MLSRWSIRSKLLLGLGLLLAIVVTLSWSGFDGLYAYRALLKNLRRINELPLATELGHRVSDLRVAADQTRDLDAFAGLEEPEARDTLFVREGFRHKLSAVDAMSFTLMKRHRLDVAFAFDHHFAAVGFRTAG